MDGNLHRSLGGGGPGVSDGAAGRESSRGGFEGRENRKVRGGEGGATGRGEHGEKARGLYRFRTDSRSTQGPVTTERKDCRLMGALVALAGYDCGGRCGKTT